MNDGPHGDAVGYIHRCVRLTNIAEGEMRGSADSEGRPEFWIEVKSKWSP